MKINSLFAFGILLSILIGLAFVHLPPGVHGMKTPQTTDSVDRTMLAIVYPEKEETSVEFLGRGVQPHAHGKAEIKRADGRTHIKLKLFGLAHPQSLGSHFTCFVVWAVTPEGKTDKLGELSKTDGCERKIEVTTTYQTFGLIVTAEPHCMVQCPSPSIVAENILPAHPKSSVNSSQVTYRGDSGFLYEANEVDRLTPADFTTPLLILGARRSIEIARRADAEAFAPTEMKRAELHLEVLERLWMNHRTEEKVFGGEARDVMRLGQQARQIAVKHTKQVRLNAEQKVADQKLALAEEEAEQAKRAAQRTKAYEEATRLQTQPAKQASPQAKGKQDTAQQRLFLSLTEILETRSEARGLIVSLSDTWFDPSHVNLTPGAREKLSKLAMVLLAYPGQYQLAIEGHTDTDGNDAFNQNLSQGRASAVQQCLLQSGVPSLKIVSVMGFGKDRPVASNLTPIGRQMNRRVEIVIEAGQRAAAGVLTTN